MERFSLLVTVLAVAFSVSTAAGQTTTAKVKIATVDMERIFSEFHKTKNAEDEVEKIKATIKKEVDERRLKHDTLLKDYEGLVKKFRDPTIAETLRKNHKTAAESKAAELRALDEEMKKYAIDRRTELLKEVEGSKAKLVNEISAAINKIAEEDGFDAVFDIGGRSSRGLPFLIFVRDPTDISAKVVDRLNANAPKAKPAATDKKPG